VCYDKYMKISLEVKLAGFRWDAVLIDDEIVATVEFKTRSGSLTTDWWVSGLTPQGRLLVIGRFSMGLGNASQVETTKEVGRLYRKHIQPLVSELLPLGGMPESPNSASFDVKRILSLTHLALHEEAGRLGAESLGIKVDIARQYELIKSFGLSGAQSLIAEQTGLPLTTVTRRLFMAREAGLLEKAVATKPKKKPKSKVRNNAKKS
jgi:hypothetical protein